jgi:hypothetical protein
MLTLEWLLVTQTLKTFDFANVAIEDGDTYTICRMFSRLFRKNTSLVNVHLPEINVNGANMARLVSGLVGRLVPNKVRKLVSFSSCSLDHDAWTRLRQALSRAGPSKMHISSIGLPSEPAVHLKDFIFNLPRMSFIKEVSIDSELDSLEKRLLLDAVKTKKTLFAFTAARREGNAINSPIEKEIELFLKLNRCGRQILDYTDVHSNLWSVILAGMTSEPSDADALFFLFASILQITVVVENKSNSFHHRRHSNNSSRIV